MPEGGVDTFESSWAPINEKKGQGTDEKAAEEDGRWPDMELVFATIRNVSVEGFTGHLVALK